MNIIKYPGINEWSSLAKRPVFEKDKLENLVQNILDDVKRNKDLSLIKYAEKLDGAVLQHIEVNQEEIDEAIRLVPENLKSAIDVARHTIEKFHKAQNTEEAIVETVQGVECWRKSVAIEKVGLYIPGGSAPLFSTILMLGIPAILAGCKEIVLCTPPNQEGEIHPAILYTASLIGIKKIFKVGGAQAIAAMAFGTETIPQVYKIFGPGNQYVTKAKELIQQQGVAIDMPAGPSEVLIIADDSGIPSYIAADLLSQAEHGADSQVILVSNDELVIQKSIEELEKQVALLPRAEIAKKALKNSKAIVLNTIEACIDFSNVYAPEHLIIASEKASNYIDKIVNAGSVFLGNYSCESAGDYASGTNHTLPTNGFAKNYSGVSLDSFQKKITFQKLSSQGLKNIGSAIEIMAEAEGLYAHKNAVSIRLNNSDEV